VLVEKESPLLSSEELGEYLVRGVVVVETPADVQKFQRQFLSEIGMTPCGGSR